VERTFDTHEAARQWRRLVLSAEKSGEGWTDARSPPVTALRDLGMGAWKQTFYRWRKRYGGVYKPASPRPRVPASPRPRVPASADTAGYPRNANNLPRSALCAQGSPVCSGPTRSVIA
jgi:hypothetical protein